MSAHPDVDVVHAYAVWEGLRAAPVAAHWCPWRFKRDCAVWKQDGPRYGRAAYMLQHLTCTKRVAWSRRTLKHVWLHRRWCE